MSENKLVPKLRFAEFTDNWTSKQLGEISEIYGRIGFRGYTVDDLVSEGEGALTLGGKHINKNNHLDLSEPDYLSWEKYEESPEIKVSQGDIITSQRGTLGRSAYIFNDIGKATINPSMVLLKNFKIKGIFLYYLLIHQNFIKEVFRRSSSTAVPMISQTELKKIIIKLPSLNEQNKISNFLSKVDIKLDLLNKKLVQTQDFKKYLMQNIFTQKIRFKNFNEDWKIYKLGDLVELMRNGTSAKQVNFETSFPVTRIETISKGIINYDRVGYVEDIDEDYRLLNGDILLSNINSIKYIGNLVYFNDKKTLYHGMNLMLMRFKEDFNKKFLYYFMKYYQQWFQMMACQAVNQASINQTSLKKFPFLIPKDIEEQNKIVDTLDLTTKKIDLIENQISQMEQFKKGLLQQMFI